DNLHQNFPNYHFIGASQTHSANIFIVEKDETLGWNSLDDAIQNCDALITNRPNIMLTILTADCVPILLFDPVQNVIAAVHAGWKGTKEQILHKTVKSMHENFNSNPKNIISGIGPSIGRCCYEVDWNVAQHFSKIESSYLQKRDKYMLDLALINKYQLLKAGLEEKNIELSNICTSCENETYFSYRKEGGCSGRFISMIGLK
ncbi:MAG TPA: peptidoglycan editing factor PgeF, partial [Campylobacterales bacterium]|nr:peptidoglycan editing factor PgeF [Campylobacterales bacterium]